MSPPSSQQWIIRGSIASAVLGLVVAACVTRENPRPTCADVADGGQRYIDPPSSATYFAVPSTDAQAPTALGIDPDPGPTCTNCKAGDGYEIMTVVDFEEGYGPAWINYGEPGASVQPPMIGEGVGADGGVVPTPPPYFGLQATDLRTLPGGARCGSRYALHMVGGYFVSWGAGYATQYLSVRGSQYRENYCPTNGMDDPLVNGIGKMPVASADQETCSFWASPVAGQPSRLGIDVSQFDGVSLWARRGPGGQAALRVALLDSNTAQESALDDERNEQAPACRRVVSCCRVCTEVTHTYLDASTDDAGMANPLTVGTTTDMRCWVPDAGPQAEGLRPDPMPPFQLTGDKTDASAFEVQENYPTDAAASWVPAAQYADNPQALKNLWDGWNRDYKTCCPPTEADDPIYGGNDAGECAPYIFHYDQSSGFYCHYPDQPPLPEKNENRCEDGFEAVIILDTEWKLYRIPWSELRRSTLGRPPFEPKSVWTIRLFPGAGWLDTYVDDIGFYRKL